jgi:hypothetical protein
MPAETLAWVTDPLTFALAGLITFALSIAYAVKSGTWVPRRTVDMLTAQYEARVQEARERETAWREANEANEATVTELSAQVGKLTVHAEMTLALLRALPNSRDRT